MTCVFSALWFKWFNCTTIRFSAYLNKSRWCRTFWNRSWHFYKQLRACCVIPVSWSGREFVSVAELWTSDCWLWLKLQSDSIHRLSFPPTNNLLGQPQPAAGIVSNAEVGYFQSKGSIGDTKIEQGNQSCCLVKNITTDRLQSVAALAESAISISVIQKKLWFPNLRLYSIIVSQWGGSVIR